MNSARRPEWWQELALIAGTYGLYTLTRNTLPAHVHRARTNAMDVYHFEQHLHLDAERALNGFLADGPRWLAVLADYTYSLAHFVVTIAVLGWLYARHADAYRKARTVLLVTTLLGLLGFWLYPLAPPRFFADLGFVDTVVRDHTWGSWGTGTINQISNQYAAMPSVHIAWSVWVAGAVILWNRRLWLRILAALYPVVVFFVILGTANHWTLDALGGAAAVSLAVVLWLVAPRVWRRLAPRLMGKPRAARPSGGDATVDRDDGARHETHLVGGDERDGRGHVLRLSQPERAARESGGELLRVRGRYGRRLRHRRARRPG